MKDRTTKLLLGLVAAGLWGLLLRPMFTPTSSRAAGSPDPNTPRAVTPGGTTGGAGMPFVFQTNGGGTTGPFPTPVGMPAFGAANPPLFVPMSSGPPAMAVDASSIYIAQGGKLYCYEKAPSMQIKSWRAIDDSAAANAVHLTAH